MLWRIAKIQATALPQSWPTICASSRPSAVTNCEISRATVSERYELSPLGLELRLKPLRSTAALKKTYMARLLDSFTHNRSSKAYSYQARTKRRSLRVAVGWGGERTSFGWSHTHTCWRRSLLRGPSCPHRKSATLPGSCRPGERGDGWMSVR